MEPARGEPHAVTPLFIGVEYSERALLYIVSFEERNLSADLEREFWDAAFEREFLGEDFECVVLE